MRLSYLAESNLFSLIPQALLIRNINLLFRQIFYPFKANYASILYIFLKVVANLPPSDPVQMSWGIVERVRDKAFVTPSIDEILGNLGESVKTTPNRWPFVEMDKDFSVAGWRCFVLLVSSELL